MNFSNDFKILNVNSPTTAGTSTITSTAVDTAGYDGLIFVTSVGTPNAGNTLKAAQSADNVTFNDLAGSKVTSGTIGGLYLEIYRPAKRYVEAVVTRGASTTIGDIWAVLYDPTTKPVTNVTSALTGAFLVTPSEGTA